MKLTIAVPTYNRPTELSNLIHSLRFLIASKVIEINIHDNSNMEVQYANRKFIPKEFNYFPNRENIGYAGNIKECVSNASGEFLWIIADDDDLDLTQIAFVVDILDCEKFDILALPFNLPVLNTVQKTKIENTFGFSVTGSMQLVDCCRLGGHDIYNYLPSAIVRTKIMKQGLEITIASDNVYYHALCMLSGAGQNANVHYNENFNMITYVPPVVVQFDVLKLIKSKIEMGKLLEFFYGMDNTDKKVLEQITAWLYFDGFTPSSIVCSRDDLIRILKLTFRHRSVKSLIFLLFGRLPLILRKVIYSAYLYRRQLRYRW